MMEWIKCSERMPAYEERVLAYDGDEIQVGYITDNFYEDSKGKFMWTYYDMMDWVGVTHWAPLPPKPEGE